MKKKVLSVLMASVMAFAMTACGSNAQTTGTTTDSTESVESTTETEAETTESAAGDTTEGAALKIAIVSSPSGVDDGSFNEDILSFIAENPNSTVTPVREETGDPAAAVQAVQDIVADYDVIVCCGFQFSGITTVAQDNPDVDFILVDEFPTDADGNEAQVDNVYAMKFAEQESGFFAGMAAALETKTGKVAVVNGIAYPSNVNYQYGFMSGVNYVNGTEGTSVEVVELPSYAGTDVTGANVGGNYVGNFSDQVFTAAKEASSDVKVIGCDVDQYDDGVNGDSNIILTSGLKVMHTAVYNELNAIVDGSFKGMNETLTAQTDSTGFVSDPDRCQLSEDTISKIQDAYEKVKAGEIVPAANFNGITPETFTW